MLGVVQDRWVEARDHFEWSTHTKAGTVCVNTARVAWNLVGRELLDFHVGDGDVLPLCWHTDDQILIAEGM